MLMLTDQPLPSGQSGRTAAAIRTPILHRLKRALWLPLLCAGLCTSAWAADPSQSSLGMTQLAGPNATSTGATTVFYPSSSAAKQVQRGPFSLQLAVDGVAAAGNRRLVVFSHGSGGSPWPMADLARSFVEAGYTVVMPEHEGDNYRDMGLVGPASWKLRPTEVSKAIDAVQQDSRFATSIDFQQVGVYGSSAGGLTALVLGGGQWSPANFKRYCLAHMAEDFAACVGLTTQLRGNSGDAAKLALAKAVHRLRFSDETLFSHVDPRIKAVLASMPMAVPFDISSFAKPSAAIGLIAAGQDKWLAPAAHVRAVQAACASCTMVLDMPEAGHGSLLSPWPAELAQSLTPLLVDPLGFARADLPAAYAKMVKFFTHHLAPAQSKP
jgi:predicted dienelactone hydrolase